MHARHAPPSAVGRVAALGDGGLVDTLAGESGSRRATAIAASREAHATGGAVSVSIGEQTATVPVQVAAALVDVLDRLAQGRGVVVSSADDLVTTGHAASLLGVSRTYVCRLVDAGELPVEYRGSHRRLRTSDVLDYLSKRRENRREALDEVSRISRAAGLYDDDF